MDLLLLIRYPGTDVSAHFTADCGMSFNTSCNTADAETMSIFLFIEYPVCQFLYVSTLIPEKSPVNPISHAYKNIFSTEGDVSHMYNVLSIAILCAEKEQLSVDD